MTRTADFAGCRQWRRILESERDQIMAAFTQGFLSQSEARIAAQDLTWRQRNAARACAQASASAYPKVS